MQPVEGLWTRADLNQPSTANPKSETSKPTVPLACGSRCSGGSVHHAASAADEEPNAPEVMQATYPTASGRPLVGSTAMATCGSWESGAVRGQEATVYGGGVSSGGLTWAFNYNYTDYETKREDSSLLSCSLASKLPNNQSEFIAYPY